MIISCPKCSKKFQVPDGAIPKAGRTVQCSSCSNKWMQYPIKEPKVVQQKDPAPMKSAPSVNKVKKVKKKPAGPIPYSKEYMQQKWGKTVKTYAENKGLSKSSNKKNQKQLPKKVYSRLGFGFFNYLIVTFVFSTFLIGILNFERSRLSRKFPFLEPYINHFFETLNNFKIFILDFYR